MHQIFPYLPINKNHNFYYKISCFIAVVELEYSEKSVIQSSIKK